MRFTSLLPPVFFPSPGSDLPLEDNLPQQERLPRETEERNNNNKKKKTPSFAILPVNLTHPLAKPEMTCKCENECFSSP